MRFDYFRAPLWVMKYWNTLFSEICPPRIKKFKLSKLGGLYSIKISSKWIANVTSTSYSPPWSMALRYGTPYPDTSYEMMTLIRETNKFLQFLDLLFEK